VADPIGPVPPTRRQAITDLYHGVPVPDPYRWLEDGDSPETRGWVAQQNQRTRQALDARPDRPRWHERLVALMGLPVVLEAKVRGDRLFLLERGVGAEQFALTRRDANDPTVDPQILFDPARASADSATAIDWFYPSADGRFVAYGVSEGGTEDSTLTVLDVGRGEVLPDTIANTRASSVAWLPDCSGFYYAAYPPDDQYNRRIRFHSIGTSAPDDPVIWTSERATDWPDVQLSPDGRFLLVEVTITWGNREAFLLDRETGLWSTVVKGKNADFAFDFGVDQLIITTTVDAPKGRVVVAALPNPAFDVWRAVVPESDAIVSAARACGDDIVVVKMDHAVDRVELWTAAGELRTTCEDLGIAAVSSVSTTDGAAFMVVARFDAPARVMRWRPLGGLTDWTPRPDVAELTVTRTTYPSKDGTEIGLFLIHRADVTPNRGTPTILNGYGGFAIAETPMWSPNIAAWCAEGGLYAIAGLRGGLEEGQPWHDAGRRANKQNVFDDFHAAADWLVETGRTRRDRLAIFGGSNGGLLVGVALTQRPDLCRAVWCAVPLLDMIRFPQFLIARLWVDEYGDPDVAEEFGWLWAYSPYHHVAESATYPALLLTTAEGDTRVDPLHARKMAALMQASAADQDQRPILLHQAGRAGHGVGKPASKRADEGADALTFFTWQLGVSS
jgi:prolyl oligopeptidase